jgi:hypothetical protein
MYTKETDHRLYTANQIYNDLRQIEDFWHAAMKLARWLHDNSPPVYKGRLNDLRNIALDGRYCVRSLMTTALRHMEPGDEPGHTGVDEVAGPGEDEGAGEGPEGDT